MPISDRLDDLAGLLPARASVPDTAEPVLSVAEVDAAERALFAEGASVEELMERAGESVADLVATRFPGRDVLVACGPGNNGGDGYVVARRLVKRGFAVRVAAMGAPRTPAAQAVRASWSGAVEPIAGAPEPTAVLVDALLGTGRNRPLDPAVIGWVERAGGVVVAVDLPSGLAADSGATAAPHVTADITVAVGALKPVHVLAPGATFCGELMVAPIGFALSAQPRLATIGRPALRAPDAESTKYSRGKVVVVGGAMAGAAHLAAIAAQRSGAGYVELVADEVVDGPPHALVRRRWTDDPLADPRISAVAIGPGLGDDAVARERLEAVLDLDRPVVLDAGALALLARLGLARLASDAPRVLTPHRGEFERLFGPIGDDPLAAATAAADRAGAVVMLKGATTIVAAPGGRVVVAALAPPWLATAGTGDVLTGIVATMLAQMAANGMDAFAATQAAVWLHGRAAVLAGPALIADDLPGQLAAALGETV